jgi:hypothetical protein
MLSLEVSKLHLVGSTFYHNKPSNYGIEEEGGEKQNWKNIVTSCLKQT